MNVLCFFKGNYIFCVEICVDRSAPSGLDNHSTGHFSCSMNVLSYLAKCRVHSTHHPAQYLFNISHSDLQLSSLVCITGPSDGK